MLKQDRGFVAVPVIMLISVLLGLGGFAVIKKKGLSLGQITNRKDDSPAVATTTNMAGTPKADTKKQTKAPKQDKQQLGALSTYLKTISPITIQKLNSGIAVKNEKDAVSALRLVVKDFQTSKPIIGAVFDAGISIYPLKKSAGFAVQIFSLMSDKEAGVSDFFVANDGEVSLLGSSKRGRDEKELSGFGFYWDLELVRAAGFEMRPSRAVLGNDILSSDWAAEQCKKEFGDGWVWAEYHLASGQEFLSSYSVSSRPNKAWVWIDDQEWECFERGKSVGREPYSGPIGMESVNYPDRYNSGMVAFLSFDKPDFTKVSWYSRKTDLINSNSALCTERLPLLCVRSDSDTFYSEFYGRQESRKEAQRLNALNNQNKEQMIQKAVSARDPLLCKDLDTGLAEQGLCQLEAIKRIPGLTKTACGTIPEFNNQEVISRCYFHFATTAPDILACDGMNEWWASTTPCYLAVLKKQPNRELCNNVKSKSFCLNNYVFLTGDKAICPAMDFIGDRQMCNRYLAVHYKDKVLCETLDVGQKDICYRAVEQNNPRNPDF